jgi:hypothetical protein
LRQDLHDLEALGLIPDDTDSDEPAHAGDAGEQDEPTERETAVVRESFGVPWFEELVEGTRLGKLRRQRGGHGSQDGRVQVEWEIIEYSGGSDMEDVDMPTPSSGKRKLDERGEEQVETQ